MLITLAGQTLTKWRFVSAMVVAVAHASGRRHEARRACEGDRRGLSRLPRRMWRSGGAFF
eukprot:SAG11_NODE_3112_length_2678_cov_2.781698_2_plen_60_part_00